MDMEDRMMGEFHQVGKRFDELLQSNNDNYFQTTEEITSNIYFYQDFKK